MVTNQLRRSPTMISGYCHKRKKNSSLSSSRSYLPLQKWRSEKQQQIYSTNIITSLRELRINDAVRRGDSRALREAAYRSLAVTARGRSLWSRAILSKAVKLKFRKQKRRRVTISISGSSRLRKPKATVMRLRKKGLPAVQRKVKVLSRLVPGCRKQPFPVVLEETTDYIVAMEMQIRALTALLSAASSSSATPPPPPPPRSSEEGEETHMLD